MMSSKPSKLPRPFPVGGSFFGGGGGGSSGGGGGGGGSVLTVPAAASSSGSSQGGGSTISSTGAGSSSSSGEGCMSLSVGAVAFGSLISIRRSVIRPFAAIGKSGAHAGGVMMMAIKSSSEPKSSGTSQTN